MNRHLTFRTGSRALERGGPQAHNLRTSMGPQATDVTSHASGSGPATRLRSIDVFRGVTVAAMVIVNNPGDWDNVSGPLLHAEWHGWTPTDLVFPFFLFIVGVSITLSSMSAGPMSRALRRGGTIFGLGLFLAGFPYFNVTTWRIPGVLQRIALCYVAAVTLVRLTMPRGGDARAHAWRLAGVTAGIVLAYAGLMLLVPVPGGHAGDLSPSGNLGAWLDRTLLGGHLWRAEWDPEGLLSTLPAVGTTLMGVIAGLMLRVAPTRAWRRQLLLGGIACASIGLVWNVGFPINKSLWTSSYVLFTGGAAAICLALCSIWSDEAGRFRRMTSEPFVALGRNAILLFVLSGLIGRLIGIVMIDPAARITLKAWIYTTVF